MVLQNQLVCSLREHPVFLAQVSSFTHRGQTKFYCSEVLCGKKGVNYTKTRTGDGTHGLKSHSKHERREEQFMDGWTAQWPYIGFKVEAVFTSSLLLTE